MVGVVSILDDKDAGAMLRALLPRCRRSSAPPRPTRARCPPATLASLAEQLGGDGRDRPGAARGARASRASWPARRAPSIATGSIYLIADLVSAPGAQEGLCTVNERGPSVLGMIALVAVVVALTILIFFALGYAFGRMFL